MMVVDDINLMVNLADHLLGIVMKHKLQSRYSISYGSQNWCWLHPAIDGEMVTTVFARATEMRISNGLIDPDGIYIEHIGARRILFSVGCVGGRGLINNGLWYWTQESDYVNLPPLADPTMLDVLDCEFTKLLLSLRQWIDS